MTARSAGCRGIERARPRTAVMQCGVTLTVRGVEDAPRRSPPSGARQGPARYFGPNRNQTIRPITGRIRISTIQTALAPAEALLPKILMTA